MPSIRLSRAWRASLVLLSSFAFPTACTTPAERARADSARAVVAEQRMLMTRLVAQKDSLSGLVSDADTYLDEIDRSVARVKGLPRKSAAHGESGIADQLQARKDLLRRVNALVTRAQETARQLEAARKRETRLLAENEQLRNQAGVDAREIAALTAQIEERARTVSLLQERADSLARVVDVAQRELGETRTVAARGYVLIGTEKELIEKGVVVKEGGMNLLVKRVGRTLVPSRTLSADQFRAIDTRAVSVIDVPDTTRRYQLVSRQSLDDARVDQRDGTTFRGPLRIADAGRFWSQSRYLILVER